MKRATCRTDKIDRYATLDGMLVQFTVPKRYAPQIDDFLRLHVNGVGVLEVELRQPMKKRSINANGYLWVLCHKIGEAVGADKETVYKELIKRVGVFDYVLVKKHAAERFRENWNAKGLGWFTQEIPYSKDNQVCQFMAYYGTSCYDTSQMARVIDEAVAEAKEMGIETMTPQELKELKDKWEKDS